MVADAMVAELFSIPAKNFRPLLTRLKADIESWRKGSTWSGDSETLKEYLKQNKIDPKSDPRYKDFYVKQRYNMVGSYTWQYTNLFKFAERQMSQVMLTSFCGSMCWL